MLWHLGLAAVGRAVWALVIPKVSGFLSLVAVALIVFVAPAYAIVQSTSTTVTNTGPEIQQTTLTVQQPGRPDQTVTVTGKTPKKENLRIDTNKPVTIIAKSTRTDGRQEEERRRTIESGAVFLRDGADLGGVTMTNTPVAVQNGSTPRYTRAPAGPATTTRPDQRF